MMNHDHTAPANSRKQTTIYRLTVACPTHNYHRMYLTMMDPPPASDYFVEWLVQALARATGGLVKSEVVLETNLDELPF